MCVRDWESVRLTRVSERWSLQDLYVCQRLGECQTYTCQRDGDCRTYMCVRDWESVRLTRVREMETVELTCVSERGRLQERETAGVTCVSDRGSLQDVHVRQRQRRCVESNDEFEEPPYSNSILQVLHQPVVVLPTPQAG